MASNKTIKDVATEILKESVSVFSGNYSHEAAFNKAKEHDQLYKDHNNASNYHTNKGDHELANHHGKLAKLHFDLSSQYRKLGYEHADRRSDKVGKK